MSKIILSALGDGAGNVSAMRIFILAAGAFLAFAKVYNAVTLHQPITVTSEDFQTIGVLIGGKLIQNTQEK